MTFAQLLNRLTTHFSERIPVIKWRISVIYIGDVYNYGTSVVSYSVYNCLFALLFTATGNPKERLCLKFPRFRPACPSENSSNNKMNMEHLCNEMTGERNRPSVTVFATNLTRTYPGLRGENRVANRPSNGPALLNL